MANESLAKTIAASNNSAILLMVEDGLRIGEAFRLPLGTEQDCGGTRRVDIESMLKNRGYQVNSEAMVTGVSEKGTPIYARDLIIGRET